MLETRLEKEEFTREPQPATTPWHDLSQALQQGFQTTTTAEAILVEFMAIDATRLKQLDQARTLYLKKEQAQAEFTRSPREQAHVETFLRYRKFYRTALDAMFYLNDRISLGKTLQPKNQPADPEKIIT